MFFNILMVQSKWLITKKKIKLKLKSKTKRNKKSWEALPILLIERYSYVPQVYKKTRKLCGGF